VIVGGKVELKDSLGDDVMYNGAGVGVHGLTYILKTLSFAPSTAVDKDEDTILISNHGLQSGDVVEYRTDPTITNPIPGIGYCASSPTNPTAPIALGSVQEPDAPVTGLSNKLVYYVVRVDANHIRLVGSSIAAAHAAPIDLTSAGAGSFG